VCGDIAAIAMVCRILRKDLVCSSHVGKRGCDALQRSREAQMLTV
jgi:hypothetical protein